MRYIALGLACLALLPAASEACSIPSYAESGRVISNRTLARDMVAAAATIDLVEVAHVEPIDTIAFFREERAEALALAQPEYAPDVNEDYDRDESEYRQMGASTITFRILDRLKGPAASYFDLSGFYFRPTDPHYSGLTARDLGQPWTTLPTGEDLYGRHLVELRHWGGRGSCTAPLIIVEGVRYLIFRDADGSLLHDGAPRIIRGKAGSLLYDGAARRAPGVYGLTAEPASEGDAWLDAVRAEVRR